MKPYTGDFIPLENQEDDLPEPIRRLRPAQVQTPTQEAPAPAETQAPAAPQEEAPAPSGLRPYEGDFVPFEQQEEPGFWSKVGNALFEWNTTPEEFKERWGYDPRTAGRMGVDAVVGALYEGPRRISNTLSAGRDAAIEAVTGWDPGAARERVTGSRDAGVPYEPLESEFMVELGSTLTPGMGAAKGASQALAWAPRFIKYLGGSIGGAFGYAASKDPGEDRMVVGEDALLAKKVWGDTIFQGLPEEDVEGRQKRLNVFLNDFADAVAVAIPSERVADTAFRTSAVVWNSIAKPIWHMARGNIKQLEESIGYKLAHKIGLAARAENPEDKRRAMEEAIQMIRDNKEELLQIDGEDVRFARDTMSALEEGTTDPLIKERARNIRAGADYADETSVRLSEPTRQTQEIIERRTDQLGGTPGINRAGEGIQQQAEEQFTREYIDPITQTEEALKTRTQNLDDLYQSDPAIAASIKTLDDAVDIDIAAARNKSVEEMRSAIRQGYDAMRAEGDALLDQLPKQKFDFTEVAPLLESNKIPSDVKKLFEDVGDETGKIVSIQGDFKELYRKAVPRLSAEINRIRKTGSGDVSELIELRDAITSKIDQIPEAEAFKDWYKNWASIFKDGKLEDFAGIYQMTQARGPGIRPVDYAAETEQVITSAMKNPHYADHVRRFLATPEAGGRPELVTDFILGDIAAQLQSQLNAGKTLREIDLSTFTKTLEDYGSVLKKTDPDGYKRVNDFLTRLRSTKGDIGDLDKKLTELTKLAEKGEKLVFEQDYKEFFNTRLRPLTGGKYEPITQVFKGKYANDRIAQILDRAQADNRMDIVDGVKAAYLQFLKDELLTDEVIRGGARATNVTKFEQALAGKNNLFSLGREVFADNPETIDLMESLFKETARVTKSLKGARQRSLINFDEFAQEASTATDKVITLTMGVLNRMAARARALKGTVVQYLDPSDHARHIMDRMLADPEYATEILKRVAASEGRGMTAETRRALEDWISLQIPNLTQDEIDEEVNHFAQVMSETPADRQTREAFQIDGSKL